MSMPQRLRPIAVVVEDDWTLGRLLEESLRGVDIATIKVNRGDTAAEVIVANEPDLVILDLALPGKSGWEVLSEIRGNPVTATIPVIIVTAMARPGLEAEAIELGANALVAKPFSPAELRRAALRLIEEHAATSAD